MILRAVFRFAVATAFPIERGSDSPRMNQTADSCHTRASGAWRPRRMARSRVPGGTVPTFNLRNTDGDITRIFNVPWATLRRHRDARRTPKNAPCARRGEHIGRP